MRTLLVTAALVAAFAATASADPIGVEFEVKNGTFGRFGATGVHTASRANGTATLTRDWAGNAIAPTATDFAMSGSRIFGFPSTGVIAGILDGDVLTIGNSVLTGSQGSLTFLGGELTYDGTYAFGSIDYELALNGRSKREGTFYFYPLRFVAGQANVTDFRETPAGDFELTLWGNDWQNHLGSGPQDGLGLDLKAVGSPVPEPGTLALLGAAAAAFAWRRRRRAA